MSKFEIKSLEKSFGDHQVLKDINLKIHDKSSLVILGGSGSGKSVLIKLMIGLIKPDSGSILYNDQESTQFSPNERQKMLKECGYLFQAGALFDSLSIKENILFFARKLYDLRDNEFHELALKKIKSVGLPERVLALYPSELSGGMQKRAALARAICTDPKVIFFDEPTTGLDPIMSNVINNLIVKAREELQATTITITHDINSVKAIGVDIAFLKDGKINWTGSVKDMEHHSSDALQKFIIGKDVDEN
ncbi:MAG: ATP-binding cassette domain-containing protein [Rickettsiaceae bacterium]|nr:ATP-binding cassette domain-containing protein [Rickettsiaceae bacterium]